MKKRFCPWYAWSSGLLPEVSHPVVQLAHCAWTPDYPIDRGQIWAGGAQTKLLFRNMSKRKDPSGKCRNAPKLILIAPNDHF